MRRSLRVPVALAVALAACSGDDERIPPIVDARVPDAAMVDAADPDAAPPDGGGIVDTAAAIDAVPIDASLVNHDRDLMNGLTYVE
jgi:hypothetical protein